MCCCSFFHFIAFKIINVGSSSSGSGSNIVLILILILIAVIIFIINTPFSLEESGGGFICPTTSQEQLQLDNAKQKSGKVKRYHFWVCMVKQDVPG